MPLWARLTLAALCVVIVLSIWYFITLPRGEDQLRMVSATNVPSPAETLGELDTLINERNLIGNVFKTLQRVVLGFSLAILIGVPIGIFGGLLRSRGIIRRANDDLRPQHSHRGVNPTNDDRVWDHRVTNDHVYFSGGRRLCRQ